MNGIIHACSHPDDNPSSCITEEKMFLAIFNYVDQLFQVISPQKVFFIAVDGFFLFDLILLCFTLLYFF